MRKVRRVDPVTYFILIIFGLRLEALIWGLIAIWVGVFGLLTFTIPAVHGETNGGSIWILLLVYALPPIFVIGGIVGVIYGLGSLFDQERMAHPIASIVRIIFGLFFIVLGLGFLIEVQANHLTVVPPTDIWVMSSPFITYSLPSVFLVGGSLMVLSSMLDLVLGR